MKKRRKKERRKRIKIETTGVKYNGLPITMGGHKKHKALGLSGLYRNDTSHRDVGIQWLTNLCHGIIVKEGCIPEDWKSSVVLPIYKGKGDPME